VATSPARTSTHDTRHRAFMRPLLLLRDGHELRAAVVCELLHAANSARVPLFFASSLEKRPLLGAHAVGVRPSGHCHRYMHGLDLSHILRMSRTVLLTVGSARRWIRGHDDARLIGSDSSLPRPLAA